jgi:hypothetical protein
MSRWSRFRTLPRAERVFFLQAWILLLLTDAALPLVGFRRWKRLLERLVSPPAALPERSGRELAEAECAARMTLAAERHGFVRPSCLERSIVLWWLLRRRGLAAGLHIGARKQEGQLEAHAWVECMGVVLNDTDEVHLHYARFDAPIAATEAEPR